MAWNVVPEDPWLSCSEWQQPMYQAASVAQVLGAMRLDWPSGRTTYEYYGAPAVVREHSPAEAYPAALENSRVSLQVWRETHYRHGFYIRDQKRKKKARRVALTWLNPQDEELKTAHLTVG